MSTKLPVLDNEGAKKTVDGRVQRRNYGRGHGYLIDGKKADGVSWIKDGSIPKGALVGWAAGAVATRVYDEPEAIEALRGMGREGFIEALKKVPNDDRDKAANRGTEVHKLAELLGRGEEVEVPDELSGHTDSYLDFRDVHNPELEMFEVVVVNIKHRIGGTLDTWAHLPGLRGMTATFNGVEKVLCDCPPKDKCLSIVDLKTSRSGIFAETGFQVCAYGGSTHYIDANGMLREMPEIRHYVSLWLRSDGWELVPFDITPNDYRTFLYMQQVAHATDWKKGRFSTIKGEALHYQRGPDVADTHIHNDDKKFTKQQDLAGTIACVIIFGSVGLLALAGTARLCLWILGVDL